MSLTKVRLAIEYEGLKPAEKLILILLSNHYSKKGECFPSIPTLMQESGLGKRSVEYTIKALAKKQLIKVKRRWNQSSEYEIFLI